MQHIITATAPGKAILLGEHAVNQGQPALAVSVGLYATCKLIYSSEMQPDPIIRLVADQHKQATTQTAIIELAQSIDAHRKCHDYKAIQQLVAEDFFAPAKYILAAFDAIFPSPLEIQFSSQIPLSAGLGSGGAIFAALAGALTRLLKDDTDQDTRVKMRRMAGWALRGDILAHGGTASGLDTQTALYGGAIRYTATDQAEPLTQVPGLMLVIGNTNVFAATSAVNANVRAWLTEHPIQRHYFQEIGLLARQAEVALREGNWSELGQLLNINQLILERIGVSCPELETLNSAALEAGALGAKLSGSGGGGIMIALVTPDTLTAVAQAITSAGGTAIIAPVGVTGVNISEGDLPYAEKQENH